MTHSPAARLFGIERSTIFNDTTGWITGASTDNTSPSPALISSS
jgi:hypothetical protein